MLLVSRIGSVESEMNVLSNLTHLSLVEAEMNMVLFHLLFTRTTGSLILQNLDWTAMFP